MTVSGAAKGVVAKAQEGGLIVIGDNPDVAALTAVPTVGTALGDVRFTSKTDAPGPAVASFGVQLGRIDEGRHTTILRPKVCAPFCAGRDRVHEDSANRVAFVSIPIACTLDDDAARVQLSEWQVLVTDAVERFVRVTPTRTELVLRSDFEGLSALAHLTQLETRCCAFFRFTFEVNATNIVLAVEVPADASSVLQSFIEEITVGI